MYKLLLSVVWEDTVVKVCALRVGTYRNKFYDHDAHFMFTPLRYEMRNDYATSVLYERRHRDG